MSHENAILIYILKTNGFNCQSCLRGLSQKRCGLGYGLACILYVVSFIIVQDKGQADFIILRYLQRQPDITIRIYEGWIFLIRCYHCLIYRRNS